MQSNFLANLESLTPYQKLKIGFLTLYIATKTWYNTTKIRKLYGKS